MQGCKRPIAHSQMRVILSVGDKNFRIWSLTWRVKILSDFYETQLKFDLTFYVSLSFLTISYP